MLGESLNTHMIMMTLGAVLGTVDKFTNIIYVLLSCCLAYRVDFRQVVCTPCSIACVLHFSLLVLYTPLKLEKY